MKVFDRSWRKTLQEKYKGKSKYVRPYIVALSLDSRFSYERKKIEIWFQDLPESVKLDMLKRLRSEKSQQHFGAFYELVTRAFFRKLGYFVDTHPAFGNENPDLLVSGKNLDIPVVVEVATVFDDPEWQKEDRKLDEILNQLDEIEHYYHLGIHVESTPIPERIDYDSLRSFVVGWFDSYNPSHTEDVKTVQYGKDGLKLSLNLYPKQPRYRKKKERILGIHGLPARFISSQQLRNALRTKASKYDFVKKQNIPYVVAISLYSAHSDNRQVINQMFGKPQVTVHRGGNGNIVTSQNSRTSDGICKPNQNTRLSGVVTVKSEWVTHYPDILQGLYKSLNNVLRCLLLKIFGKPTEVHRFSLIRNPHARVQLEDDLMKGYPQFTKTVENSTLTTYSWIDEESCVPFDC